MKFTAKICFPILASTMLFGMNAAVFADGDHHYAASVPTVPVTRLGASLVGATGFTGTGSFQYSDSTNGGSLHASVHLPVLSGGAITDSNAAVSLAAGNAVTLTILNGTSTVATYNLAISDIDFAYSTATTVSGESAEYVVSAAESSAAVYTVSIGSDATGAALPVLAAGETVSIAVSGATVLSGTLAASVGH